MSDIEQRNKDISDKIAQRTQAMAQTMANLRNGYLIANDTSEALEAERMRIQEEKVHAIITKSIADGTASALTLLNEGFRLAREAAKAKGV